MGRGWPWDPWDVLDWIALGLLGWMLLAVLAAVIIGRGIRLADRRAAGRMRHAPPAGWLEHQLPPPEQGPETPSPPAGSRVAGGDVRRGDTASTATLGDDHVTGGHRDARACSGASRRPAAPGRR